MNTFSYIKSVNADRNRKFLLASFVLVAVSIGSFVWKKDVKPVEKPQSAVSAKK